jgi:hypothetical protein
VNDSDDATKLLVGARATLRTTFRPRFELRVPRFFFDLRFVAAKVAADYAKSLKQNQDRTADYHIARMNYRAGALAGRSLGEGASLANLGNRSGCPTMGSTLRLRASHVGASAGVDLDCFAFLDEERHVNGHTGFQLCRLRDVTGSIAANAFR